MCESAAKKYCLAVRFFFKRDFLGISRLGKNAFEWPIKSLMAKIVQGFAAIER